MFTRTWKRPASTLIVSALGLAVVGCGGGGVKSASHPSLASSRPPGNSKIAAEVPASIHSAGVLTIETDAAYAPDEFIKPGTNTIVGFDVDLITAIARTMGLKPNLTNVTFDGLIPGLAAAKYDLAISSMTDTKVREKVLAFVTYFSAGTSFYVRAGSGVTVGGLADLCGKSVAVVRGTTEASDAAAQNDKCKSAGKPGVSVLVFPDLNGQNLAISSGRAQVGMADSPVAAYEVRQSGGRLQLSGTPYGTAPYGIALPKQSGLVHPIRDALKLLMGNGQYAAMLNHWGLKSGAITAPVIDGAKS